MSNSGKPAKAKPAGGKSPKPAGQNVEVETAQYDDDAASLSMMRMNLSGPLPPPEFIRGYEEVSPGFADRVIKMAEAEQAHRHVNDAKIVDAEVFVSKIAPFVCISIVLLCLMASIVSIYLTKDSTNAGNGLIASGILGSGGIGVVVWAALRGIKGRPSME